MKPVLMIHEIRDELFELPLEDYTLTFDDGLYCHYTHFNRFVNINTDKIFFISTNIIATGVQSQQFIDSASAHKKAMTGNYEDYMSLGQLKELAQCPNVYIGGHSHEHFDIDHLSLAHKIEYLKNDTETMLDWFQHNMDFRPTKFCYPFNKDYKGIYTAILKQYGFTEFYGSERIDVECLFTSHQ